MIDAIKERANFIQEELWGIAKEFYGLERTAETVERIQQTFSNFLVEKTNSSDLTHSDQFNEVDRVLALAFMTSSLVERYDDPQKALEILVAATTARGMAHALGAAQPAMDLAGRKISTEKMASELAKRRHAENYALIDSALKYWKENIDPTISASKAANMLLSVVPLSHKKLAEIVSAEKKKQL